MHIERWRDHSDTVRGQTGRSPSHRGIYGIYVSQGQTSSAHLSKAMRQAVPAQVTVPTEHFAAVGAVVGLDVRVGQEVGLEVAPLVETPAARRTLVRRIFHVQDLVDGQCPRLAEPLATLVALEGLLLGMDVPIITIKYNAIYIIHGILGPCIFIWKFRKFC